MLRPPIKGLLFIWLISCCLAIFALGEVPLRDFDEGTVARVALELSEKNGLERFLPSLWNNPYLNKPPGLHWFISFSINWSRLWSGDLHQLPSEFCVRVFPAIFSTFVVPLGGLIQWHLRPKDKLSAIGSSLILLTLLPVVRHGRLAMLDGTQLSAIALLWFFLITLDQTKKDKFRWLGAGFTCSFMLLLKAPLLIPAFVAALLPLLWEKKFKNQYGFYYLQWFWLGLIPGVSWHCLNALSNGSGALWLWWGDGAGRVLFDLGSGSELGFWVPIIEFLEGGWPWLLLWPFGLLLACSQLHTRWGSWAIGTQLIMAMSILPLKMQLPWYSHPLWLPFALICAPPLSWLVRRHSISRFPGKTFLAWVPFFISFLGLILILFIFIHFLGFNPWAFNHIEIILPIAIGWALGGVFLTHSFQSYRLTGLIFVVLGSLIGLFFLMGSNFWLWELNENWDVRPVAELLAGTENQEVYIYDSFERPSLNWYARKKIKSIKDINGIKFFLNRSDVIKKQYKKNSCKVINNVNEWDFVKCKTKLD